MNSPVVSPFSSRFRVIGVAALAVLVAGLPDQAPRAAVRNAEDLLQYMTLDGRDDMYLMSRFVGQQWDASIEAVQPR